MTFAATSHLAATRPLGLGFAALAGLVMCLVLWAATAPIDGAIVLHGAVGDSSRAVQVILPDTGRVSDLLVSEGGHVDKGATLLRLDATVPRSALRAVDERRTFDQLARVRAAAVLSGARELVWPADLRALIDASPTLARRAMDERAVFTSAQAVARAEDAALRLSRHEADVARIALDAQLAANTGEQADVRRQLGDQDTLSRKRLALTGTSYLLRRDLADLTQAAARLSMASATLGTSLATTEADIARQRHDRLAAVAAELSQIDQRLAQLQADRVQIADRIAGLTLKAPVAGTVSALQITAADMTAVIGRPVMTIIPDDTKASLTAAVAPDRVADLREGMAVRVVFRDTASTPSKTLRGTIRRISQNQEPGQPRPDGMMRAIVTLDAGESPPVGLRNGTPADVMIPSNEHTTLGFLLAPLTNAFTRPAAIAPP